MKSISKIASALGILASTIALSGCETSGYTSYYNPYPTYTPKPAIIIEQPRYYNRPLFHPVHNHHSTFSHPISIPRVSRPNHPRPVYINPPNQRPNHSPLPSARIPASHHPSYNSPSRPSRNSTFSAPAPRIRHTSSRSIRIPSRSRHR